MIFPFMLVFFVYGNLGASFVEVIRSGHFPAKSAQTGHRVTGKNGSNIGQESVSLCSKCSKCWKACVSTSFTFSLQTPGSPTLKQHIQII